MSLSVSYLKHQNLNKNDVFLGVLDILVLSAILTISIGILTDMKMLDAFSKIGNQGALALLAIPGAIFLVDVGTLIHAFKKKKRSPPRISTSVDVVEGREIAKPPELLKHLVTLNGHGGFSEETFTLPPHAYVLAPSKDGFENPYILSFLPDSSLEEMMRTAEDGQLSFPLPTTGGYRLYRPGDQIPNIKFYGWKGTKETEFEEWRSRVPPQDSAHITGDVPHFAVIPVRSSTSKKLKHKDEDRTKVKMFGTSNLKTVMEHLLKTRKNPSEPVVLLPFVCNNKTKLDPIITLIDGSGEKVESMFHQAFQAS